MPAVKQQRLWQETGAAKGFRDYPQPHVVHWNATGKWQRDPQQLPSKRHAAAQIAVFPQVVQQPASRISQAEKRRGDLIEFAVDDLAISHNKKVSL